MLIIVRVDYCFRNVVVTCGSGMHGHTVACFEEKEYLTKRCKLFLAEEFGKHCQKSFCRACHLCRSTSSFCVLNNGKKSCFCLFGRCTSHKSRHKSGVGRCNLIHSSRKICYGSIREACEVTVDHTLYATEDRSKLFGVHNSFDRVNGDDIMIYAFAKRFLNGNINQYGQKLPVGFRASEIFEGRIVTEINRITCHRIIDPMTICDCDSVLRKQICNRGLAGPIIFTGFIGIDHIKSDRIQICHNRKGLIVSSDGSLANGIAVKTGICFAVANVIEYVNNIFSFGLCRIIEGCISISSFAVCLFERGVRGDVCVKNVVYNGHAFAKGKNFTFIFKSDIAHCVKETYENDLNVGVHLNDSVNEKTVVNKITDDRISDLVQKKICLFFKARLNEDGTNLRLNIFVGIENQFLEFFGLDKLHYAFNGNVFAGFIFGTEDTDDIRKHLHEICAESSVTDTNGDQIGFRNFFLIVSLKLFGGICTDIRAISTPTVIYFFLASAEKEKKIFRQHTGNRKLAVVYLVVFAQVSFKLKRICILAVYTLACKKVVNVAVVGVLLITVKAVTVCHGVAKRHVVELGLVRLVQLIDHCAYSRCAEAEEHDQGHENSQSLCAHCSEFHF